MLLWLSLFLSFSISFLLTPLVISLTHKFGYLDLPNRKHPAILHKKPIPRAGGISPLLGFLASLFFVAILSPDFSLTKNIWGIIISSVLIVVVGLFDDKYDLSPYLRLVTNIFAVLIVVGFGIGIASFTNPFGGLIRLDSLVYYFNLPENFGLFAGKHSIILLADLVAFVWIIWIMNALNWSSGVDGQLSGIATIALCTLGIASAQLLNFDPNQINVALVSFAAAGAFLGFLPWSFYPQKIMPGYGGATLAGFLVAVLAILSGAKLATALLIILVPLVDSVWAVVRRLLNRRSPVWGDSYHLHHQLLKMGWTIPQICFLYYAVGLILGILALNFDTVEKFFAIVILGVLMFALLFTLYFVSKRFNKSIWSK